MKIRKFNEGLEDQTDDKKEGEINSQKELEKFSLNDITIFLGKIGYSVIRTAELDRLEDIVSNHPG